MTTANQPPHLLSLPPELRELIYSKIFPNKYEVCCVPSMRSIDLPHNCILKFLLCNKQIFHEVRAILHRRMISFSSTPDSGQIISNFPCLHGVDFMEVPCIRFELNPFQYTVAIPKLWLSLLDICQILRSVAGISRLQVHCDGTVPRIRPPFYINEADLDRGPLNIVLLLQPFNLISNVRSAEITILGGPLNNLWSKNDLLEDFVNRLTKRLEAPSRMDRTRIKNLQRLRRQIQLKSNTLWFADTYQNTLAGLANDSEGPHLH